MAGIREVTKWCAGFYVESAHKTRHALKLVSSKIESMYVVNVSGEKAWDIEKAIMENFSKESQPISGFVKEATNYNNYQDVCDFVDSLVLQGD